MTFRHLLIAASAVAMTAGAASAETLRWARAGDSLTMDPHAQNEGPTSALAHQIMEPLIMRDMSGAIVPALATDWGPSETDPNVWTFNLRDDVGESDDRFTSEQETAQKMEGAILRIIADDKSRK